MRCLCLLSEAGSSRGTRCDELTSNGGRMSQANVLKECEIVRGGSDVVFS